MHYSWGKCNMILFFAYKLFLFMDEKSDQITFFLTIMHKISILIICSLFDPINVDKGLTLVIRSILKYIELAHRKFTIVFIHMIKKYLFGAIFWKILN